MLIATSQFELPSHSPEPVYGAPCGLVDYFDFPLDPPDAWNVRGGQDFSVYRERYSGIHTGEDWWYAGRSSLGMPVYSIGYGQVSYAHTYGWGRDLGTLVIRHVLQSGRTIYSFYGHLDPDSLDLRLGDCVTRGQVVGLIGDPRSSPHLHFEVRSVFANQPGPGYWSSDPVRAGWYPPSQTIEDTRLAISPGLVWWHNFEADRVRYLGELAAGVALIEVDDQLLAFDLLEGIELATTELSGLHTFTRWDPARHWLVTADMSGRLRTYHLHFQDDPSQTTLTLTPIWEVETHQMGSLNLFLLANNWIAVMHGTQLTGIDPAGEIGWEQDLGGRLQGSLELPEQLILTTDGADADVWSVDRQGAQAWDLGTTGIPLQTASSTFLYTRQGLFRLDLAKQEAIHWLDWDTAFLNAAQIIETSQGQIVVNHQSLGGGQLIWFDAGGRFLRRVSYTEAIEADDIMLLSMNGEAYLVSQQTGSSSVNASVFRLIPPDHLQLVFRTVTRQPFVSDGWAASLDNGLLLALQGVRWMRIEP